MPGIFGRSSVTLIFAMVLIAVVWPQTAHGEGGCKISALAGAYGLAINGYISFSSAPPPLPIREFSPISVAGTLNFESAGTVNRSVQINLGGAVVPVVDAGTYIRNPDCTFTITHGNGEIWIVTPVKNGAELEFLVASVPGAAGVGAGTMIRKTGEE